MRIYLAIEDNGEEWEDYCEWVACAATSPQAVVNEMERRGFDRRTMRNGDEVAFWYPHSYRVESIELITHGGLPVDGIEEHSKVESVFGWETKC